MFQAVFLPRYPNLLRVAGAVRCDLLGCEQAFGSIEKKNIRLRMVSVLDCIQDTIFEN